MKVSVVAAPGETRVVDMPKPTVGPADVLEVTRDIVANCEKYAAIVSHTIPFDNIVEAIRMASTPGAADKVVVTFK